MIADPERRLMDSAEFMSVDHDAVHISETQRGRIAGDKSTYLFRLLLVEGIAGHLHHVVTGASNPGNGECPLGTVNKRKHRLPYKLASRRQSETRRARDACCLGRQFPRLQMTLLGFGSGRLVWCRLSRLLTIRNPTTVHVSHAVKYLTNLSP